MDFHQYQEAAAKTAIYPKESGLAYTALGLNGEAGEVAEKVKKVIRDTNGTVSPERRQELIDELGDVLWYAANLAIELETTLDVVASRNVEKLRSRQERGQLQGSGDRR